MPPLAAFIIKLLSAELSLLPAFAAVPAAGLAVGAGPFAPLFNGGYWFSALAVLTRPSAATASAMTAIREIIRFLFISVFAGFCCRFSALRIRMLPRLWM